MSTGSPDNTTADHAAVRICRDDYNHLQSVLLQGDGNEYAAVLYAGTNTYKDDGDVILEFLITEVSLISPSEYLEQGPGIVSLGPSTLRDIAVTTGDTHRYSNPHAILLAHSHPHGKQAGYSPIDDSTEPDIFEALANDATGPHGSLLVSEEEIAGRVWPADPVATLDHGMAAADPIDEIVIVGEQSLRREQTANTRLPDRDIEPARSHARQALVTGREGNARLGESHVAIAGVGGIGSLFVEDLATQDIGELTVIDPDVVEYTNLSRIPYADASDAGPEDATPDDGNHPAAVLTAAEPDAGRPKVDVAADYVERVDSDIKVTAVPYPIDSKRGLDAAAKADVIVAATDHTKSREVVSEIGQRYLRPVFDAGSRIKADDGEVYSIETTFAMTGPPFACRDCQDLVEREAVRVADLDEEDIEYGLELLEDEQPAVLAVNRYPAARAGFALYGYLTGLAEDMYKPTWEWDTGSTNLLDADHRPLPEERPDNRCPRCSSGRTALRATGDRGLFGAISSFEDSPNFTDATAMERTRPDVEQVEVPTPVKMVSSLWKTVRDITLALL
ncbi:ThiF family adenylyltransferase [Haloarculaceae archaeon H-GB2-1]|nr:ThiF family adenylyltransferase [Haloarculaceae archaeon H-GB1-1]MEA5406299.1 ThiF family adenylyltransferase [Haloarculaceae archaeon H-GB2-1]